MNIQYILTCVHDGKTAITIAHEGGESCITVYKELSVEEVVQRLSTMFDTDVPVYQIQDNYTIGHNNERV